jgi:hypothetical protein
MGTFKIRAHFYLLGGQQWYYYVTALPALRCIPRFLQAQFLVQNNTPNYTVKLLYGALCRCNRAQHGRGYTYVTFKCFAIKETMLRLKYRLQILQQK